MSTRLLERFFDKLLSPLSEQTSSWVDRLVYCGIRPSLIDPNFDQSSLLTLLILDNL